MKITLRGLISVHILTRVSLYNIIIYMQPLYGAMGL